jgi:hypothetical protein
MVVQVLEDVFFTMDHTSKIILSEYCTHYCTLSETTLRSNTEILLKDLHCKCFAVKIVGESRSEPSNALVLSHLRRPTRKQYGESEKMSSRRHRGRDGSEH